MNIKFIFLFLLIGLSFYNCFAPVASNQGVQNVNSDNDIKGAQSTSGITVVKFYRPGCPHCQHYEKPFSMAANNHPECKFFAVNTDTNSGLASTYGIGGVPTTVILKNGKEKSRFVGNDSAKLNNQINGAMKSE